MRASPACQVSLQRFGVWRAALSLLSAAGVGTLVAWWLGQEAPRSMALLMVMGLALAVMLVLVGSLWRVSVCSLRWDGLAWQLDAARGELSVAIDLGPWMLLKFKPENGARRTWLRVQRRGLEAQWHALRCVVYSSRPAASA